MKKTLKEFQEFYKNDLIPILNTLDLERKSVKKQNFFSMILLILIVISTIIIAVLINKAIYNVYFDENSANIPLIIMIVLIIIEIVMMLSRMHKKKVNFIIDYKSKVITPIVHFLEPSLKYSYSDSISLNSFLNSKLFLLSVDRFKGEDYISGKIDKTDFAFSEVKAEHKTESTNEDGRTKESWTVIFKGLFFKADFNKNFKGEYFVLPDFAEKKFGQLGNFFQKLSKQRGELIKLEDIEFEKEFVVYGSDQIEARYILSSSIMSRILEFKKKSGKKISISFVDSNIYIAIPYDEDIFKPRYYRTVVNEKATTEYYNVLDLVINIIEDLNLNTRIWSKE